MARTSEDGAWHCFLLTPHATVRRSEGCNPGSGCAMISIDQPVHPRLHQPPTAHQQGRLTRMPARRSEGDFPATSDFPRSRIVARPQGLRAKLEDARIGAGDRPRHHARLRFDLGGAEIRPTFFETRATPCERPSRAARHVEQGHLLLLCRRALTSSTTAKPVQLRPRALLRWWPSAPAD